MKGKENSFKILILGESKVGKSSVLNMLTEKTFTETLPPTLGIDYKIFNLTTGGVDVKLQIWDTAGQERFRSITENFYRGCQGILLVFDLSDFDSFEKIKGWLNNIYEKADRSIVICLVGNKLDLKDTAGVELVNSTEILTLCESHGIKYFPVSAKRNLNIIESFTHLANEILKKQSNKLSTDEGTQLTGEEKGTKKSCC